MSSSFSKAFLIEGIELNLVSSSLIPGMIPVISVSAFSVADKAFITVSLKDNCSSKLASTFLFFSLA